NYINQSCTGHFELKVRRTARKNETLTQRHTSGMTALLSRMLLDHTPRSVHMLAHLHWEASKNIPPQRPEKEGGQKALLSRKPHKDR
ncbi:hypothetical protein, partial [Citrobacter freundii]|uniref:hypothetical protein n=1 Tax=Citrobacter freundii TaxID=546 RepID=UPI001C313F75